jgi:small-conductance mechanosensitive channel
MKKLKHILSYPLIKIFKHDLVLKITVRSIFILFVIFSFAWVSERCFNNLHKSLEAYIYFVLNTIYLIIALLPLGYFISKYKFCVTTLVSFYMIIFLRVFWMINKYIIKVPNYEDVNIVFILFAWLVIIYDRYKSIRK